MTTSAEVKVFPDFQATHMFTDERNNVQIPVMRLFKFSDGHYEALDEVKAGSGYPSFFTENWERKTPGRRRRMIPIGQIQAAEPVQSEEAEPPIDLGENIVTLHADAIYALFRSACLPDWNNSIGYAESGNGDSATLVHHDKNDNSKIVRVCEIDKATRQSRIYNIRLKERYPFELC